MSQDQLTLVIATEFSATPGPRYELQGPYSGEKFLKELLQPRFDQAVSKGATLLVDLDGTEGYVLLVPGKREESGAANGPKEGEGPADQGHGGHSIQCPEKRLPIERGAEKACRQARFNGRTERRAPLNP